MNDIFKSNQKIKALGFYQILCGIVSLIELFRVAIDVNLNSNSLIQICVFILLFMFSISCGILLFKENPINGLKLSNVNQALQTLSFAVVGFVFKYTSGIAIFIGLDLTNSFEFSATLAMSKFQLNFNNERDLTYINVNLVALLILVVIGKLQSEILNKEKIIEDE